MPRVAVLTRRSVCHQTTIRIFSQISKSFNSQNKKQHLQISCTYNKILSQTTQAPIDTTKLATSFIPERACHRQTFVLLKIQGVKKVPPHTGPYAAARNPWANSITRGFKSREAVHPRAALVDLPITCRSYGRRIRGVARHEPARLIRRQGNPRGASDINSSAATCSRAFIIFFAYTRNLHSFNLNYPKKETILLITKVKFLQKNSPAADESAQQRKFKEIKRAWCTV